MDSGEITPRKKHKKRASNTPQGEFTPFVLKIVLINESDLPTQRDYFFANNFTLKQHGLLIGQPVLLTPLEKPIGQSFPIVCHPWPIDTINRNCVSLLQTRLSAMGVGEGDFVRLLKIDFRIPKAISVEFKCLSGTADLSDKDATSYLATQLNGKYVFNGSRCHVSYKSEVATLDVSAVKGFSADSIKGEMSRLSLFDNSNISEETDSDILELTPSKDDNDKPDVFVISNKTVLNIEQCDKELLPIRKEQTAIRLKELAGIEKQAREIQDIIDVSIATDEYHRNFRMNIPSGILVCGNRGVGKTTLLASLATHFEKKTTVKFIQTETVNLDCFQDLTNYQNSVVLLDDIDGLNTQKDYVTGTNTLVSSICQLLDYLQREGGVLVATCTQRQDVDRNLKRPGRLEKEIDLVSPNSEERLRILQSILELTPNSISVPDLSELAWRAHGYVAGDLRMVAREGTLNMLRRLENNLNGAKLEIQDLQEGLKKVRPSAMRDVILEVPRVKWNDIGGMQHIIQKIKETVEWPLQHPEAFTRLGLRPPKGILLYGPPGCSKTMIARAIATESGLNFLAVKGPEIFSKWVGDSEKAVRDIFMKAKMASPAIIFFDEIDALAVEREGQGSRVSDRVLTQLLTEMDGLERLEGVTVVAATNRPDLMDKALLRPGRMDRLIYIPIPNAETRKEIFRIKLSKMSCEPDLSFDWLIGMSDGFSGAEIVNVCEEAAMICLQENIQNKFIQQKHLETAAKSLKPQITKEMNEFYETFSKATIFKKI